MFNFFAENLKALRKREGFSQTELAEKLGLTRNMVASYERKLAEPKMEILVTISQFFNLSLDALIGANLSDRHVTAGNQRHDYSVGTNGVVRSPEEILVTFEKRINHIEKMISGFRKFYEVRIKNGQANDLDLKIMNEENLLYILESVVEVNKQTTSDLRRSFDS